jgi:MFS family permease
MIVITVVLGSFTSVLDTSIISVALPQMLGTFAVSLDAITWVAVSYSIGTIIMTTMAGAVHSSAVNVSIFCHSSCIQRPRSCAVWCAAWR